MITLIQEECIDMKEELREQAERTRFLYKTGAISKSEAKEMINDYAKYFNEKSKELAVKYNRRPMNFSFEAYMR